jgi:hypothetical protein
VQEKGRKNPKKIQKQRKLKRGPFEVLEVGEMVFLVVFFTIIVLVVELG